VNEVEGFILIALKKSCRRCSNF